MTDFYTNLTDLNSTVETLREKVAELQLERDEARLVRDRQTGLLTDLKRSLQQDLADWAEQNLQSGDDDYNELSELMVNNGLEGLKRKFTVTVRVSYDFEVEVEAANEDEARDEVDNDLTSYVSDNVSLWDTPDDYEIDATDWWTGCSATATGPDPEA